MFESPLYLPPGEDKPVYCQDYSVVQSQIMIQFDYTGVNVLLMALDQSPIEIPNSHLPKTRVYSHRGGREYDL